MLLKKKNLLLIFVVSLVLSFGLTSCGTDDPDPVGGTMDDDPTDNDPGPTGFLGEIDFVLTYGGSGVDEANDVVEAHGGGYLVFGTTRSGNGDITDRDATVTDSDFWALKLDATGGIVWSKTYGGPNDEEGYSVAKSSDGGYVLSGYSRSSNGDTCGGTGDVCGNEGFLDYWIVKIDGSGTMQWEQNFGFLGGEKGYSIIQTSDGGYFATGVLDVTGSGGAGNDGLTATGGTTSARVNHGLGEFWGIKMDAGGNKVWRRYFGGTSNEEARDVLQTSDGGYLLGGFSESSDVDITDDKGSYDYWVVKVGPSGGMQWTKSFGGSEIDNGFNLAATSDGNYMIVGDTRSTDKDVSNPIGNADLWVVKFSGSNGSIIWERTYGGTQFDSAQDIRQTPDGNYIIAGSSRSSDGDLMSNNGQNDAWVLVINESGIPQFEMNIGGSDIEFGNAALQTADNKLILVGETDSNDIDITLNKGIKDLMVVKIK